VIGRSKWCVIHRQQNEREQWGKRQRKHRQKVVSPAQPLPVTP
jgi:hypothetical protein